MIFIKLAIVLLATGVANAQDAIKVTPAEISETRTATLIKKENVFSSNRDSLSIKLHVEGAALNGATRYGKIKISSAVDDAGNKLKLEESRFGRGDDYKEIDRFMQRDKDPSDAFDMSLDLSLPPRSATAIKTLKGEFEVLAGGDEKIVTLKNLTSLVDKPAKDPILKSVGMKVRVTKAEANSTSFAIEYSGKITALKMWKSSMRPAKKPATARWDRPNQISRK